jgi:lipoate-protein ligase A
MEAVSSRRKLSQTSMNVTIDEWRAPAAELHQRREAAADVEIVVMVPERPAMVFGSAQRGAATTTPHGWPEGIDRVVRSSGGGAVLVHPAHSVWIDLFVSRHVAAMPDDVVRSMLAAGRWWADAVASCGVSGAWVYDGAMLHGATPEVCFSGRGPGEVMLGENKLVGLSQRRTRHSVRIQGQFHVADPTDITHDILGLDRPGDDERPALWPDAGVDAVALGRRVAAALGAMISS